jgi:hypothetical protein
VFQERGSYGVWSLNAKTDALYVSPYLFIVSSRNDGNFRGKIWGTFLRLLDAENKVTAIFRNVGKCLPNDTAVTIRNTSVIGLFQLINAEEVLSMCI